MYMILRPSYCTVFDSDVHSLEGDIHIYVALVCQIVEEEKRKMKNVKKSEKSVDKVFPRWYYSQAVRRESDTESR